MKTLIKTSEETPAFYEQEISASFENGGHIDFTVRGNSIAGGLEILLSALAVVELDADNTFDLRLRYWHLTEDLVDVTVEASEISVEDKAPPMQTVLHMVEKVKGA